MQANSIKVEAVANSQSTLGEGPHWDIETQSLYYVDLLQAKICRYAYAEDKIYESKIEGELHVGFIIPIEGKQHKFAVGCARKVLMIDWDGKANACKIEKILYEVQQDEKWSNMRLNDGKCDAQGRLFAGTMSIEVNFDNRDGQLFRFDENGQATVVKDNICISNGLDWSVDNTKMYYIDTADFEVKEYDYDEQTGKVDFRRVLYDFRNKSNPEANTLPDGMTIDKNGTLYVATYNGTKVQAIKSDGTEGICIAMPCKQITSAAFGGPNLDILFVTTSKIEDEGSSAAGFLYKVTGLGTQGIPMHKMKA